MSVPSKRAMDWPERLAIFFLVIAAVAIVQGGLISSLAFAVCAMMGWSRKFDEVRSQGKDVMSGKFRIGLAAAFLLVGLVFWPTGAQAPATSEQAMTSTFGITDAADACKEAFVARASHPSTVEFPTFDYDFREYDGGRSKLLMSAKARNSFNLQVSFDLQCDFESGVLTNLNMSEASPKP